MTLVNQAKTKAEQQAATADTYQRKISELRYAIAFEEKYSKDWILERYLNIAYFGDGAYGIEAASRHYFSKPASDLTLREAALLAGLVKNPTGYDPTERPRRAPRSAATPCWPRMAQLNVDLAERGRARREAQRLGLKVDRHPQRLRLVGRRRSSATTPSSTSSPTRASARPSRTGAGCCSAAA